MNAQYLRAAVRVANAGASLMPTPTQSANALSVAASIVQSSGPLGRFRRYWATNSVWLPWNVLYNTLYEDLKLQLQANMTVDTDLPVPPVTTSAPAFVAASLAAVLTHHPDVIMTRLEVRPVSLTLQGRRRPCSTPPPSLLCISMHERVHNMCMKTFFEELMAPDDFVWHVSARGGVHGKCNCASGSSMLVCRATSNMTNQT
jgi:hypothetical protein